MPQNIKLTTGPQEENEEITNTVEIFTHLSESKNW